MRNVISPIHFSPVKEQKTPVNASSNGPFFYNQILDMIADLEATRANREENISEKRFQFGIPIIFSMLNLEVHEVN